MQFMSKNRAIPSSFLTCLLLLFVRPVFAAENATVNFGREIQPIFAKHCYQCHGPNEAEGGLQLDSQSGLSAELDSGNVAIVAGDVAHSVILDRIRSTDESERMPPEGKGLSKSEVGLIERWISQGAHWSAHWAFEPLLRPDVPTPRDTTWSPTPIDAFILSRLEAAQLRPSPAADKATLLRRAYFDLTGLPPTPAEVTAFLADNSPDAFEKVVDQLLDSEHYGEKWARHWLDLVRYAETNGYERDSRKDLIWKYRDYVIEAFNTDKPIDRFITEQIAGDELPDRDAASITATGFYRLGIWDDEPADRPLARYDYLDDILRTTGETFLAMTIGCARCHDHKIDPVTQKDYYSMLAFFSDISPHGKGKTNHIALTNPKQQADFEQRIAEKQKREEILTTKITARENEFRQAMKEQYPDVALPVAQADAKDSKVLLPNSRTSGQAWEYTFQQPPDNWFEIAFDDSKWLKGQGGFGTAGTPGSKVRTEWKTADIWLRKDFRLAQIPSQLSLTLHHDEKAEIYLNGKEIAILTGYVTEYFTLDITQMAEDVLQTGRNTLAVHCHQTGGGQYIDVGLLTQDNTPSWQTIVKKYGEQLLGSEQVNEWKQWQADLLASQKTTLELKPDFAMAVSERGRNKTWVLARGNPSAQGEEVSAAFPQILNPPELDQTAPSSAGTATSGKRQLLAEWITSPDNPMTARTFVNRIWHYHFGRGIVRTTSDFGFQGMSPTHPDLLNWLTAEFIESGWRLKALHKQMMMTQTYQMSSSPNPEALAVSPTNDLFWRFNMRRLTGEELRDAILAMTDTLNPKMFGPSVYPPLPQEVLATASRPGAAWGRSSPEDASRRSIYIHVKRSLRHPMLASFDAPDTDTGCAVRLSTTVPTQALGMLNGEFINQQAKKFSDRLRASFPDDLKQQIATGIQLTTGRSATPAEIQQDFDFIQDLQQTEKVSEAEALRNYCLVLLNANEFIYLD